MLFRATFALQRVRVRESVVALPSVERKVHESPAEVDFSGNAVLQVVNAPTKKNQTLCWQCFTASTAAFTKHRQGCRNRSSLRGKRKIAD